MTHQRLRAGCLTVIAGLALACGTGGRVAVVAPPLPPAAVKTLPPVAVPTAGPVVVEEPVPAVPERPDVASPRVRVLLSTPVDLALPQAGRRFVCVADDRTVVLRGPLRASATGARMQSQVGAFGQEGNARLLAERLDAAGIETRIEAAEAGVLRVFAVAAPGEVGDAFSARLGAAGMTDYRPAGAVAGTVTVTGGEGGALSGARIRVVPLDPEPVEVGDKAVRGEIEVRATAGNAVAINVVNLEEYLRGVVPAEMGPRVFPVIEALKAQAVAARTYAVAHLGDHAAEGYDLCDTTACQVYGGADVEHPLSDEAIRSTAGEIMTFSGAPIDAMYHSTCGGHTEDAAALFAGRGAPYLKGVTCQGDRMVVVGPGTGGGTGRWFGAVERLAAVAGRIADLLAVQRRAGPLAARLGGHPAGSGAVGLGQAFNLNDVMPLVHERGPATQDSLLALLRTFRMPVPPPDDARRGAWEMALVVRLGELAGEVQELAGRLVPGPRGLQVVGDKPEQVRDVPGSTPALERRGENWRSTTVEAPTGSAATVWSVGDRVVLVEVEPTASADASSSWSWWIREFPADVLASRLGGEVVTTMTITGRGVSGRARAVRIGGAWGNREILSLAFRHALDLPDTLFTIATRRSPSGLVWRFLGRGWGHGVGMCQNGAAGLARGGADYRKVLGCYYTGVQFSRFEGAGGTS